MAGVVCWATKAVVCSCCRSQRVWLLRSRQRVLRVRVLRGGLVEAVDGETEVGVFGGGWGGAVGGAACGWLWSVRRGGGFGVCCEWWSLECGASGGVWSVLRVAGF